MGFDNTMGWNNWVSRVAVEAAPMIFLSGIAFRTILQSSNVGLIDACLKVSFYLICGIALLGRRRLVINKRVSVILISFIIFGFFPIAHWGISDVEDLQWVEIERIEIIRIIMAGFTIFLVGALSSDNIKIQNMAKLMAIMGAITGLFAVYHSMTGHAQNAGRYITTGMIRAGSETSDSNVLSAFLNFCSLMSIYLYLTTRKMFEKFTYIIVFLLCQSGRLLTFSTGGHIGFLISAAFVWAMYMKKSRSLGRMVRILVVVGMLIAVIIAVISSSIELQGMLFSRFNYADKYIYEASIGSRLHQYGEFVELVLSDAVGFIVGFGYASTLEQLGIDFDIHNMFLRAFAAGGLLGFVFYLIFLVNVEKILRTGWSDQGSNKDNREWLFRVIIYASFLGWMVQGMTLPADVSILTLVYAVFAASLSKTGKSKNAQEVV